MGYNGASSITTDLSVRHGRLSTGNSSRLILQTDGATTPASQWFDDITKWTTINATKASETTLVRTGPSSMRVTATAGQTYIYNTRILEAATDFTASSYRIGYYIDPATAPKVKRVLYSMYAGVTDAAHQVYTSRMPINAGWNCIELVPPKASWETWTTGASFNLAAVTHLRLDIELLAAADGTETFVLDEWSWWKPGADKARLSLYFDDGDLTHWQAAAELEKRGMRGTFAITTNYIDTLTGCLSWDQCRELDRRGHLIVSHSHTHRAWEDLTHAQREWEVVTAKRRLLQNGLVRGASMFCPPYEFRGDQSDMDMLFRYNTFVRNTWPNSPAYATDGVKAFYHWCPNPPLDPRMHWLGRADKYVAGANTLGMTADGADLDDLIAKKAWGGLMWHVINGSANRMSMVEFAAYLDLIAARENAGTLEVVMPTQLVSLG